MLAHGLLGLGLLSAVLAQKTHHITVGGSNGQTFFTPHFVKANPQDTITFLFNPKNHTVTQSSFDSPCLPLAGGIDTGFRPVTIGTAAHERPTFNFTVTDANPSWFYCRQGEGTENSHCGAGMVFAINPGDRHSDNSFRKFRKNAEYQGEALATAPAPASSAPAATASVGPDQLDTLTALDTDNSTSGGGLGSYGPAIVGLLAGILLALVGLLAVGVMMYIRRGARPGRSIKRNSTYAPVHGHTAPMMMDDGYHEESLSSSTPLKYSEQGL